MSHPSVNDRTGLWLGAAGPVAMGAVLGLPAGTARMLSESLLLPAVVGGLALGMAPALYIALSLATAAPPAREVAGAMSAGLRAQGLVLAGLAPAVAFLLTTTQAGWAVPLFGVAAVGTAALFGLRQLFARLWHHGTPTGPLSIVFAVWALVGLGLGAHLFLATLDA